MKKKVILLTILAVVLLGGGTASAFYYYDISNYIKTDDAKVQGDLRSIGSLAAGTLIEWNYRQGDSFKKGSVLGIVETSPAHGNVAATTSDIVAPDDGTIIETSAVKDQTVAPGAPLALSADLNELYVTANLKETELADIHIGSHVAITIDAFPGTPFEGKIVQIGLGTNSTFSLLPTGNASGNYTKVVQKVPVKIALDNYLGKRLIPGLNATVKIDR
jgi:multidrug resistance efflux pump